MIEIKIIIIIGVPILILQIINFLETNREIKSYGSLFPDNSSKDIKVEDYIDKEKYNDNKIVKIIKKFRLNDSTPLINKIEEKIENEFDIYEESIKKSVTMPLYLGLFGTIWGVIIGLGFFYSKLQYSDIDLDNAAKGLILGIMISMIVSVFGLGFMSWNWYNFNKHFSKNNKNKKKLITYLEDKYFSGIAAKDPDFQLLINNLNNFNKSFSDNIENFKSIFSDVETTFQTQKEILKELNAIDIKELVNANANMVNTIASSREQFEIFNSYLTNTNEYLNISKELLNKSVEIYEKFGVFGENVENIAKEIRQNLNSSTEVINFLNVQLKNLEERRGFISDIFGKIDEDIKKSFEDLAGHIESNKNKFLEFISKLDVELAKSVLKLNNETETKIKDYKSIRLKHEEDFVTKLNENVKNIERLQYIENIYKALIDENGNIIHLENLARQSEELNKNITEFYSNIKNVQFRLEPNNNKDNKQSSN